MATFDYKLSDGRIVTFRKLKMKDLLEADNTNNNTLRAMKLVASAIVKVDGEDVHLTYKDIAEWDIGDFQKASDQLSEFSGVELNEREVKKEY